MNDSKHTALYKVSLIKGVRTLWTHPSPGFVVRFIPREDLDLFLFEFDTDSGGQIRAYHQNGSLIFQKDVRSAVLSTDGQVLAYLQPVPGGPGTKAVISRIGKKKEVSFPVPPDTNLKAVSSGGKVVLLADEKDHKNSIFWAANDKGKELWSMNGDLGFLDQQETPLEVLFLAHKGKIVQYVGFTSGRVLRNLPVWKYQMLTHRQAIPH